MKEYLLDLHIHSVLSPCADITMTPGNIVKEAKEKNINIIAITDHNSYKNVKSTIEIAQSQDIYVIPGIEVQSKEDIHLLSYFNNYQDLKEFGELIYKGLPDIKNDEDKMGHQILVDNKDKFIKKEEKLLLNSLEYSIEELVELTYKYNGIPVPSHADRSFGLIQNLGFIPEDLDISYIEMNFHESLEKYIKKFPYLKNYTLIKNSDSHHLEQIKATMKVNLTNKPSTKEIFSYFSTQKNNKFLVL